MTETHGSEFQSEGMKYLQRKKRDLKYEETTQTKEKDFGIGIEEIELHSRRDTDLEGNNKTYCSIWNTKLLRIQKIYCIHIKFKALKSYLSTSFSAEGYRLRK